VDDLFGASVALSRGYGVFGAPGTYWNTDYPGNVYTSLISRVNISADYEKIVYGDTTTLSWISLDATSVSIDNGIGQVDKIGAIPVSPTHTTTYTITATGPWGTFTDSVTVVGAPFAISIQSPSDRDSLSRPDVRVEGAIRNPLGREIGITVNGVMAIVEAGHFVANHVPLEQGENTITVTAVDMEGNTETDSINVYVEEIANYVRITADPESGVAPFETTLRIEASFGFNASSLRHTGPGTVEILSNPVPGEYLVRMTTPGLYAFTAQVQDAESNVYTDSVTILVMDLATIDGKLRAKWNAMKSALIAGDNQKALGCFHGGTKSNYDEIFSALGTTLPGIASAMGEISPVYHRDRISKYRIRREEVVQGQTYNITYYIYFVKDSNGLWQIESF
jgi:hypothetical protein